ncbi:MAG TPA: hypothetical protein VIX35_12970, partial [Vicinamibacterales bacterium]
LALTRVRLEGHTITAAQALARPTTSLAAVEVAGLGVEVDDARPAIDRATLEAECKYQRYIRRHEASWARTRAQEGRLIPADFAYAGVPGLSREMVERLTEIRPATVGQAARVPGVTPAAVAIVGRRPPPRHEDPPDRRATESTQAEVGPFEPRSSTSTIGPDGR